MWGLGRNYKQVPFPVGSAKRFLTCQEWWFFAYIQGGATHVEPLRDRWRHRTDPRAESSCLVSGCWRGAEFVLQGDEHAQQFGSPPVDGQLGLRLGETLAGRSELRHVAAVRAGQLPRIDEVLAAPDEEPQPTSAQPRTSRLAVGSDQAGHEDDDRVRQDRTNDGAGRTQMSEWDGQGDVHHGHQAEGDRLETQP